MSENPTNKQLQENISKWIELVLSDTEKITKQNAKNWDYLEPTYSNVRKVYDMVDKVIEQNESLRSHIRRLENRIDEIENKID